MCVVPEISTHFTRMLPSLEECGSFYTTSNWKLDGAEPKHYHFTTALYERECQIHTRHDRLFSWAFQRGSNSCWQIQSTFFRFGFRKKTPSEAVHCYFLVRHRFIPEQHFAHRSSSRTLFLNSVERSPNSTTITHYAAAWDNVDLVLPDMLFGRQRSLHRKLWMHTSRGEWEKVKESKHGNEPWHERNCFFIAYHDPFPWPLHVADLSNIFICVACFGIFLVLFRNVLPSAWSFPLCKRTAQLAPVVKLHQ